MRNPVTWKCLIHHLMDGPWNLLVTKIHPFVPIIVLFRALHISSWKKELSSRLWMSDTKVTQKQRWRIRTELIAKTSWAKSAKELPLTRRKEKRSCVQGMTKHCWKESGKRGAENGNRNGHEFWIQLFLVRGPLDFAPRAFPHQKRLPFMSIPNLSQKSQFCERLLASCEKATKTKLELIYWHKQRAISGYFFNSSNNT